MNTSVIIAVVILYEIVSIGGCALYLKMKERKNKGGQAAAGDDFSTGGQSMTWPVVGASLALSLLGTVKIFGIMQQAINLGAVFHSNDISTDHDIAWNRAMGTKTESCHHAGIIWKNVWSENPVICVCGNSTSDICYSYDRNAGAWNCV